jgi:hypothetical protein
MKESDEEARCYAEKAQQCGAAKRLTPKTGERFCIDCAF